MKIAVYTIAKDEEKNVKGWAESCANADYVVACDTGSTDQTHFLLSSLSSTLNTNTGALATVHKVAINPWRFDMARNAALALVPADADICIPLDMDERLSPGWRMIIEECWKPGTTKARFNYVFGHKEDGSHGFTYVHNRIHARNGYHWVYPDHEGVYPYGLTVEKGILLPPQFFVEQFQDRDKDRSGILTRLNWAMREYPDDPRVTFYYARELYYAGAYDAAIPLFETYFIIAKNHHPEERSEAAACLAECWKRKK